jgi:pimeloyl-ACP methyl ester carboxylesterase
MNAIWFVLLAVAAPAVPLRHCYLPGLVEAAQCGVLDVPRLHEKPSAGSLTLHFAVLPAMGRDRQGDPLFLLAGGPGQSARAYAGLVPRTFRAVRRTRDVVLVDLRGTGESSPLPCPPTDPRNTEEFPAALATCRASLPRDLSPFTTARRARDLDSVRAALGYARINLWAGSFGTREALIYARLFPDRVRSVVLDGAVPLEHIWPLGTAQDSAAALELRFARCERDAACRDRYPRLRQDFGDLLRKIELQPRTVTLPDPETGELRTVRLTRADVASTVKVLLYSSEQARLLPLAIDRLRRGDARPLLAAAAAERAWSVDTMALGLTLRLVCAEEMPRLPRETEEATRGTFLGDTDLTQWSRFCRDFEAEIPRDLATRPLATPALILSGALDPVAPPRWGEMMRRHFPRSAHIVVDDGAHNVSFGGCMPDVIAKFIDAPDPAGVAVPSCATHAGHGDVVLDGAAARP